MQIGDALRQAAQSIQNRLGLALLEASFEANLLCQHVLVVHRAWLISHENDVLEANQQAAFEALVQRRLNGEPIAYILGSREFYGLPLKTTPATLIPRPDTEALVEAVEDWASCYAKARNACPSGYSIVEQTDNANGGFRNFTFKCKK